MRLLAWAYLRPHNPRFWQSLFMTPSGQLTEYNTTIKITIPKETKNYLKWTFGWKHIHLSPWFYIYYSVLYCVQTVFWCYALISQIAHRIGYLHANVLNINLSKYNNLFRIINCLSSIKIYMSAVCWCPLLLPQIVAHTSLSCAAL